MSSMPPPDHRTPRQISPGEHRAASGPFRSSPSDPNSAPAPSHVPSRITISAARVRCTRIYIIVALVVVHVAFQIVSYLITPTPWLYRELFHLDQEDSFPTWYSASALLCASLLISLAALRERRRDGPLRWHWAGLAAGVLILSIDEIAGIHETLNSVTDFSWTIPAGIGAVVVFALYLPFLRPLPKQLRGRLIAAVAVFLLGSLVVEYLTDPFADAGKLDTLAYNLSTVPEEALEMFGVFLLIRALIAHLGEGRPLSVAVGPKPLPTQPHPSTRDTAA